MVGDLGDLHTQLRAVLHYQVVLQYISHIRLYQTDQGSDVRRQRLQIETALNCTAPDRCKFYKRLNKTIALLFLDHNIVCSPGATSVCDMDCPARPLFMVIFGCNTIICVVLHTDGGC